MPYFIAATNFESHLPGVCVGGYPAATCTLPQTDEAQFGVRRHFGRNETIFENGSAAGHVYRVMSGTVRLCRYASNGRRFVVDFAFSSELVGFTNRSRHIYDAEAVGDCVLVAYPRNHLQAMMAATPSGETHILAQMTDAVFAAQQHALSIGCQDAEERVAAFLLRMADRNGVEENETLHLPMNRRDIADHLALCVETVCRTLRALKTKGIFAMPNTHDIVIKNIAALRALGCADGGANPHA